MMNVVQGGARGPDLVRLGGSPRGDDLGILEVKWRELVPGPGLISYLTCES
jgi:hypothetical protein